MEPKGFFAALFDFEFKELVTIRVIRILYIILLALIGLGALGFFVAFASRGVGAALAALIFVPLIAGVYVILARIYMEVIIVLFKIQENTERTAVLLAGGGSQPPPVD